MFGDGFPRPDGRARFTPASVIAPEDVPDDEYPMILMTGRQLEHWHTGSMTRNASVLDALEPEPVVSVHPDDIAKTGIEAGDFVEISSRRGTVSARVP